MTRAPNRTRILHAPAPPGEACSRKLRATRTRSRHAGVTVALLAALALAPAASAADPPAFVDWVATGADVTNGTLFARQVALSGPNPGLSIVNGTYAGFSGTDFTPSLPTSDAVYLQSASGSTFTVSFGGPVQDPVLQFADLGSRFELPSGAGVSRLSGSAGFTVLGRAVTGAASPDNQGTVRLSGVFESVSFTGASISDGVWLQVGASPPAPPAQQTQPNPVAPDLPDTPAATKRLRRVRAAVRYSWVRSATATRLTRLTIAPVRGQTTVEVRCAGTGCPFRLRSVQTRETRRRLALARWFGNARLRPGARVEVRILRAGRIGKVVVYRMRRDRGPKKRQLCLVAGATDPARC